MLAVTKIKLRSYLLQILGHIPLQKIDLVFQFQIIEFVFDFPKKMRLSSTVKNIEMSICGPLQFSKDLNCLPIYIKLRYYSIGK